MDAGVFAPHGCNRGGKFYVTALTYAQFLCQSALPGRAILTLDRALGADLRGDEPELREWPMPYEAMAWILANGSHFGGNPRVHFQHLAGRMNEPRREQRRWRIWACWRICRIVLPDLRGDPEHNVEEPDEKQITRQLEAHALPGEAKLWLAVVKRCRQGGVTGRTAQA